MFETEKQTRLLKALKEFEFVFLKIVPTFPLLLSSKGVPGEGGPAGATGPRVSLQLV